MKFTCKNNIGLTLQGSESFSHFLVPLEKQDSHRLAQWILKQEIQNLAYKNCFPVFLTCYPGAIATEGLYLAGQMVECYISAMFKILAAFLASRVHLEQLLVA